MCTHEEAARINSRNRPQEYQGFSVNVTKAVRAPAILTKIPQKQNRSQMSQVFPHPHVSHPVVLLFKDSKVRRNLSA
jgi:hypothetical protein